MDSGPASLVMRAIGPAAISFLAVAGGASANDAIEVVRHVRMSDQTTVLIRFDHARGRASRLVVDQASGKILLEQAYPGRPQSSRREFEQAVAIIGRHVKLSALMAQGAVAEGGFIVDGPPRHPVDNRYIQIRLLAPDRRTLWQVVLVDLTERAVVSARSSFE
jgi:hypothetical protein